MQGNSTTWNYGFFEISAAHFKKLFGKKIYHELLSLSNPLPYLLNDHSNDPKIFAIFEISLGVIHKP